MRIVIDAERCSGHGRCYDLAPTLFQPDDDGYTRLVSPTLRSEDADAAELAVRNCPEQALSIES